MMDALDAAKDTPSAHVHDLDVSTPIISGAALPQAKEESLYNY